MKVKILKEEGFDIALRGMAYSYKDRAVDPETWWPNQRTGHRLKLWQVFIDQVLEQVEHPEFLEDLK